MIDVFEPKLDNKGIDYILKLHNGKHKEIQIKTRNNPNFYIEKNFKPQDNYFIICYREDIDTLWILPSKIFYKYTSVDKKGRHTLYLGQNMEKKLEEYKSNWKLIIK